MQRSYKVYISSTYEDLKEQRQAAARAVRRRNLQPFAMQEDLTASEIRPVDKCCDDVKGCDIYIGIIAFRYGSIPAGYDKSITQLEYEAAGEAGIERLIFLVGENARWTPSMVDPDRIRINAFRKLVMGPHIVKFLEDVNQLEYEIAEALLEAKKRLDNKRAQAREGRGQLPGYLFDNLSYLNNRSKQQEQLEEFLCQCEGTLHQKPIVGIIHGDEHECHDKFIEKLQEESLLPKLLHLPPDKNSIKEIKIHWPVLSSSAQQRLESLKNKLSQSLLNRRNGTIEEIVQALNFHLTPVLIHSTIQAGTWQKHEQELIDKWIDFWDHLPDLAIGKKLLVFLCFKYKNIEGMGRSEAKKYERLNKDIRDYIENLNLEKYANINGLVLTELCRITYDELDEWITKWAAVYCDAELLRYKIDQYYKRQGMNAICMCLLAQELKELCRQTLKPGV